MVLAAMAMVYAPVVAGLVRQWADDENYSHGFLVAPIALWLMWRSRRALASLPVRPHGAGLAVAASGILLLAAGQFGAEMFLTRISLLIVFAGSVLYLAGPAHLRALAFPLVLLVLVIPLPALVMNRVSFPLQLLASRTAEGVLTIAGVPVLREGNVLVLPHGALEVAQACSGVHSLASLISLALIVGGPGRRALLAAVAVPIAVLANAVRVAGTGLAAAWIGQWAAQGFLHAFSGWVMFVAAFAALYGCARAIDAVGRLRAPIGPASAPVS
jgi:exosortase